MIPTETSEREKSSSRGVFPEQLLCNAREAPKGERREQRPGWRRKRGTQGISGRSHVSQDLRRWGKWQASTQLAEEL